MTKKVYPTMVTPFKADGSIDYDGAEKIVKWYIEKGCQGVFAVCQSSEMSFLSLDEKVRLAKSVVSASDGKLSVVASGHTSESLDAQAEEINAISETGIDAFILVSNRFDLHNDGDDEWIKNAEYVLSKIDPSVKLGIYECPMPYKRFLSDRILSWCIESKRFKFIKDTCCDFSLLKHRAKLLSGTGIELYNANAQSILASVRDGAAGYSGIMANFHPELYVWLMEHYDSDDERVNIIQAFLALYAFTEAMDYPVTAKYHMKKYSGIDILPDSRWRDKKAFTEYQRLVVDEEAELEKYFIDMIKR